MAKKYSIMQVSVPKIRGAKMPKVKLPRIGAGVPKMPRLFGKKRKFD